MLEYFFSETYLPKLEEDAKTLKLDPSIYKKNLQNGIDNTGLWQKIL